jgi:hypothetical protein
VTAITHASRMSQARKRTMPAHLVTPRRQIANPQNLQSVEQVRRIDAERRAKILEAENIAAAGAGAVAFEPAPDLDEVTSVLAVLSVYVSQVASNRVFQNRQQKFQFALDNVISPDEVGVLSRQQESGVE